MIRPTYTYHCDIDTLFNKSLICNWPLSEMKIYLTSYYSCDLRQWFLILL